MKNNKDSESNLERRKIVVGSILLFGSLIFLILLVIMHQFSVFALIIVLTVIGLVVYNSLWGKHPPYAYGKILVIIFSALLAGIFALSNVCPIIKTIVEWPM